MTKTPQVQELDSALLLWAAAVAAIVIPGVILQWLVLPEGFAF